MEDLRTAMMSIKHARDAQNEAYRAAWSALREVDPQLAEVINSFWPDDDVAAQWFCSPHSNGLSPAEMVLAGRSDMVLSIIRKAEHGFVT